MAFVQVTTLGRIAGLRGGPRLLQINRNAEGVIMVTYKDNHYNTFTKPLAEVVSVKELKRLTELEGLDK